MGLLLRGYAKAGALDGEHESFYRRCCQLIEVKKEEGLSSVGFESPLSLAIDHYRLQPIFATIDPLHRVTNIAAHNNTS